MRVGVSNLRLQTQVANVRRRVPNLRAQAVAKCFGCDRTTVSVVVIDSGLSDLRGPRLAC
jgi:hypothetical protein